MSLFRLSTHNILQYVCTKTQICGWLSLVNKSAGVVARELPEKYSFCWTTQRQYVIMCKYYPLWRSNSYRSHVFSYGGYAQKCRNNFYSILRLKICYIFFHRIFILPFLQIIQKI